MNSLIRIQAKYPEFDLSDTIKKGTEFYLIHLMDGFFPKWDEKNTYPIDIADVAMSILLLVELEKFDLAKKLIQFSVEKMSDGNGQFYFKYFEKGTFNKTVFIRWGQAWMFKALTYYLHKTAQIK